jgi:hypothetical protein
LYGPDASGNRPDLRDRRESATMRA